MLALTSRCPLGSPAAGMQGIFCLAWSSEVIQGDRFTLKWETKKENKTICLISEQIPPGNSYSDVTLYFMMCLMIFASSYLNK